MDNLKKSKLWTDRLCLLLGPAFMLLTCFIAPPEEMSVEAWRTAGLAVWLGIWWVSEVVPIPVTSLVPLLVVPLAPLKGATTCGEYILDRETCRLLAGSIKVSRAKNQPAGMDEVTLQVIGAKSHGRTRVQITAGDLTVKAKPIDGKFPNYARVIPKEPEKRQPLATVGFDARYIRDGGAVLQPFAGPANFLDIHPPGGGTESGVEALMMVAHTGHSTAYAGPAIYVVMPKLGR